MAKIHVADDDADGRKILARYLQGQGHEVSSSGDGEEALKNILIDKPDLVVLDLFMPRMDGRLLLEVLRSYLRLQSLPVVLLTALDESPLIEQARALKVSAILVKGKATLENIGQAIAIELHRVPN